MRREIQTNNSTKNVNSLVALKDNLLYMISPRYLFATYDALIILFTISALFLLAIKSKNTLSIIFTTLCILVFSISVFILIKSHRPTVTFNHLFFNYFKI